MIICEESDISGNNNEPNYIFQCIVFSIYIHFLKTLKNYLAKFEVVSESDKYLNTENLARRMFSI